MEQKKHFVLVHGACHGAWCWYKVKPILESIGHKVIILDLAAAGINTKTIEEVRTLEDYSSPLLEAVATIPQGEKVILVGHSLGGYSLAVAMEKYPTKISLAIFVTAVLPDTINNPFYVLDQTQAMEQKKHFVLVHGACHGAWCWYKVKPILESIGHKVTILDLAAAGINTKTIEEVRTLEDYSSPLLEAVATIPQGEKVILVGHSLGGYSLAVAMEKYPTKISLAIFVTAVLPDTINNPFYVLDQCFEKIREGGWLDTKFDYSGTSQQPHPALLLGPKFVEAKLYHLSPVEDITLATTLLRPVSILQENRTAANTYFSEERYGSVQRAYIVCDQDQVASKEFQYWVIANAGVKEVKEIKGADHMPMFSKPRELCAAILELA